MISIPVRVLPHGEGLDLPRYQTPGSAGMDLLAAVPEDVVLNPGAFILIPTGISVSIPPGFELQVRPRSGLAARHGITVLNSPGTIDSDYRGEVGVILLNCGPQPFSVTRGLRIAQLVLARVESVVWQPVTDLDTTDRGAGGFGHTGTGGDAKQV